MTLGTLPLRMAAGDRLHSVSANGKLLVPGLPTSANGVCSGSWCFRWWRDASDLCAGAPPAPRFAQGEEFAAVEYEHPQVERRSDALGMTDPARPAPTTRTKEEGTPRQIGAVEPKLMRALSCCAAPGGGGRFRPRATGLARASGRGTYRRRCRRYRSSPGTAAAARAPAGSRRSAAPGASRRSPGSRRRCGCRSIPPRRSPGGGCVDVVAEELVGQRVGAGRSRVTGRAAVQLAEGPVAPVAPRRRA